MAINNRVRNLVLERIGTKVYHPRKRIDSLRALAAECESSVHTVYQVMNQLVTEGVLRAEPGRGYFVNGRSERSGSKSETCGLMFNTSNKKSQEKRLLPMHQQILATVQQGMSQQGWSLLMLNGIEDDKGRRRFMPVEDITARRLSGLFLVGMYELPYLAELSERQKGLVALDVDATDVRIDSVVLDQSLSGMQLVQKLCDRGARRIAFIGGPLGSSPIPEHHRYYDSCAKARFDGWRMGLEANGIPYPTQPFQSVFKRESTYFKRAVDELLAQDGKPDAILAESTVAVQAQLDKRGFGREEVLVAGWMEEEPAWGSPYVPHYYALCDFTRMAHEAVQLLERRLESPELPIERILIPLEIREAARPVTAQHETSQATT